MMNQSKSLDKLATAMTEMWLPHTKLAGPPQTGRFVRNPRPATYFQNGKPATYYAEGQDVPGNDSMNVAVPNQGAGQAQSDQPMAAMTHSINVEQNGLNYQGDQQ
jgi:hypothetical protein